MEKKEKKQQQQQSSKKGSNKPQSEKGQQQQQKRSAKAAPKVDQSEDVKREQKLQAILLADSFTSNFRPVSAEGPKVLLPLVNVPMLEYTLEFLSQNGVEEVRTSSIPGSSLLYATALTPSFLVGVHLLRSTR